MRRRAVILLIAIAISLSGCSLSGMVKKHEPGERFITVSVTDVESGLPVHDALITVSALVSDVARTDDNGIAKLRFIVNTNESPASYRLRISSMCYQASSQEFVDNKKQNQYLTFQLERNIGDATLNLSVSLTEYGMRSLINDAWFTVVSNETEEKITKHADKFASDYGSASVDFELPVGSYTVERVSVKQGYTGYIYNLTPNEPITLDHCSHFREYANYSINVVK